MSRQHSRTPVSRACLAGGLALLVIALGLLAVRPDWHAAWHGQISDTAVHGHGHSHEAPASERGCAIELFASGLVDGAAAGAFVLKPFEAPGLTPLLPADQRPVSAPHFAHPERGPPLLS